MQNVNTDTVIRYVGESKQQVIDSRDVAKMIGKTHKNLMRDIRSYINDLEMSSKLSPSDFFIESDYLDSINRTKPCYLLTKQGCKFVANKLTGLQRSKLAGKRLLLSSYTFELSSVLFDI